MKGATGIDLAFDVDKLLLSPSLAVAHGRFDQKKLAERLTEHRYVLAEHKGRDVPWCAPARTPSP